jgi:hypothetical protein
MKCPNDDTVLVMSERQGIEIDYCPQCRGVWLDKGELDKMIDKSSSDRPNVAYGPAHDMRTEPYDNRQSTDHHYKKHKKESFLGDIFDF